MRTGCSVGARRVRTGGGARAGGDGAGRVRTRGDDGAGRAAG